MSSTELANLGWLKMLLDVGNLLAPGSSAPHYILHQDSLPWRRLRDARHPAWLVLRPLGNKHSSRVRLGVSCVIYEINLCNFQLRECAANARVCWPGGEGAWLMEMGQELLGGWWRQEERIGGGRVQEERLGRRL